MDKDLIERLANEGGVHIGPTPQGTHLGQYFQPSAFQKIAAVIAEECAKEADSARCYEKGDWGAGNDRACMNIAEAIRAMFKPA